MYSKSLFITFFLIIEISSVFPHGNSESLYEKQKFKLELDEVKGFYKEKAIAKFGETPEVSRKALKNLKEFLRSETNMKVPIDDDAFLIRFLRYAKFDTKEAFERIKNYFNFKRKYKEYSRNVTLASVKKVYEKEIIQILPNRSKEGSRIAVLNIGSE
jgi:hypothetical protein